MTEQRKYREDEVREIFGLAARRTIAEPHPRADPNGLTLADLQDIGREAGLEPEAIARAAATFDARGVKAQRRTSLGMPIEVGRIVPLPRALTDTEWEQLVAELRSTFGARGSVTSQGNLREWANGNLHACIEPSGAGYRLRIGTLKGDATPLNAVGATLLATGVIGAISLMFFPGLDLGPPPTIVGAAGAALMLSNLVRLRGWGRQREKQMEHIAAWLSALVNTPPG